MCREGGRSWGGRSLHQHSYELPTCHREGAAKHTSGSGTPQYHTASRKTRAFQLKHY